MNIPKNLNQFGSLLNTDLSVVTKVNGAVKELGNSMTGLTLKQKITILSNGELSKSQIYNALTTSSILLLT